jgi:uncharacterized protein YaiI (UPF0178 family)
MKIWIDADACPRVVKEILFRASALDSLLHRLLRGQRPA